MALDAGLTITDSVPGLRTAMHAVPLAARDQVVLQFDVMLILVRHVIELGQSFQDTDKPDCSHPLSDDEAQEDGEFWYACAAGEWLTASPEQPETIATP